jgi:hypothetical protein
MGMKYTLKDYAGAACILVILGIVKPLANGCLLIHEETKKKRRKKK